MDITDARYYLEHRLLPDWFEKETNGLISVLMTSAGDFFCKVLNDICKSENLSNPYSSDMYHVNGYALEDEFKLVKIIMPEPERSPLCHRIYLCFDGEYGRRSYFTVEKSFEGMCLCGWEEGAHLNYGAVLEDEEMERVVEMGMRKSQEE